jgi:hypothetical protein
MFDATLRAVEIDEIRGGMAVISKWLERFAVALARVAARHELVPAEPQMPRIGTKADFPDLPRFLDRRGEAQFDRTSSKEAPALSK